MNPRPIRCERIALPTELCPQFVFLIGELEADGRIRTDDLLITSELLYQLSYISFYMQSRYNKSLVESMIFIK